jgi:hypothetical protein
MIWPTFNQFLGRASPNPLRHLGRFRLAASAHLLDLTSDRHFLTGTGMKEAVATTGVRHPSIPISRTQQGWVLDLVISWLPCAAVQLILAAMLARSLFQKAVGVSDCV